MAEELIKSDSEAAAQAAGEEQTINIKELYSIALSKWYWFLISLAVTLSIAVLYILHTEPQFTRTASLLVKEDSSNGSKSSMALDFSDFGMFQSKANIQNEIQTVKSISLMSDVVTRLKLNDVYSYKKGLRTVDLYRCAPAEIHPLGSLKENSVGFEFVVNETGKVTMDNFFKVVAGEKEEIDKTITAAYGDTVSTPVGVFTVSNPSWEAEEYAQYVGKTIKYRHVSVVGAAKAYAETLKASLGDEKSTIINISIEQPSVKKADDMLLTLISAYNDRWIQDKNMIAVSTSQFIDERLAVIESELGSVDSDISSYKSEHLLPDVAAVSGMYLQQSAKTRDAIVDISTQQAMAEFIRKELSKESLTDPLPANTGIDNASISSSIEKYNAVVLDRNRLLANSSERNPVVLDAAATIKSLKASIMQSIDTYIASLDNQMRALKREANTTTSQLSASPNQAKYLLSVERQQKVKEALYLYLLQKREENELSQAFTAYNSRMIDAPYGQDNATSPRKLNVLLVAFVLGLLIPVGVIFAQESMNTTVRGRKDLDKVKVPFLGEVPLVTDRNNDEKSIVVRAGSRDIINEAFRVIRTNLDFMSGKDHKLKIITVTSFNPGSGKSFLTMNIAFSFAIKGSRVLVVDGDLRHGSTSTYVHSPKTGISDYLADRTDDYRSLIVSDAESPNLHVLPVGSLPPNPTELLEDDRFAQLLEKVRDEYDYIFIDCPPIDIVADTQIIARHADRTIFVVRAGLLERSMLPELDEIYTKKRFNNMTLILNGTTAGRGRYSYHYGYGSRSRYGYYGSYGYYGYYGSKSDSDSEKGKKKHSKSGGVIGFKSKD